MLLCPSSNWISLIPAPFFKRCVAHVCLSMWGFNAILIFLFLYPMFNNSHRLNLLNCSPFFPTNKYFLRFLLTSFFLIFSTYLIRKLYALSPSGTSLSFFPLPFLMNNNFSSLTKSLTSRFINSLDLIPVSYNTSNIVLFLNPTGLLRS